MTTIESKKVIVPANRTDVHQFLSQTDNLVHLLPKDKISDWKSDGKVCSFKIQGAYTIGLEHISSDQPDRVVYKSTAGSPFPFTLTAHLEESGDQTNVWQLCDAELNPFLVMIVKDPLRNLFDYMAERLTKQFEA